jgi:hypothetical protein
MDPDPAAKFNADPMDPDKIRKPVWSTNPDPED